MKHGTHRLRAGLLCAVFLGPHPLWAYETRVAGELDSSQDPPQQDSRGPQGPRRVYKDQVVPHWFANNTRFWYRNDLRGGAKEFIVVDAERGTRGRAFDHETVAKRIGEGVEPTRLPINELRFSDDAQKVTLVGPDKSWELNVTTGELLEAPAE